ncbi:MAG: hypothetical protein M1294_15805 [Firmicutes bacterium]|jgi:4,5-DOPA dioxygenase extradiol|nr:hypothetical protein [Bacillota bacterium]MCL5015913.1 hypothetical protein [Bacillota bacterium]
MAIIGGIYAPNTPTLIGDLGVRHPATEKALQDLGERVRAQSTIDAALVVSPHFVTAQGFGLVGTSEMRQLFDFQGFPPEFYQVRYMPPGAPRVAQQLLSLCTQALIPAAMTKEWGLDHGAWAPLVHLFPRADVPIIPLSICPELGESGHDALGKQIQALAHDFNLLLIATGSLIHRLDLWNRPEPTYPEAARQYLEGVENALETGDWSGLWRLPRVLRDQAAPEGGEYPLRVIAGAIPSFRGEILAEEQEFGAVSLTTVYLEPMPA